MAVKKLATTGALAIALFSGGQAASAHEFNPNSIVDHLIQEGQDHSFSARAQMAEENGIKNYRGQADQNIELLYILRNNNRYDPGPAKVSSAAPTPKAQAPAPVATERKLTVTATAYTAYCAGCSGTTATGVDLRANPNQRVIAVDPSVIPLGSRVYVEGYGEAIASDTGGAIKGNRIDIFMPNYDQAVAYGKKQLTVTILD